MSSIRLGVVPVKRGGTSLEVALEQKELILEKIDTIKPDNVELVNINDLTDSGILYELEKMGQVENKLKTKDIDGLFMPHCDFGTEEIVGRLAKKMGVPFLLWGPRDDAPDPGTGKRSRDNQCGIFASSKVLQRYKVPFSYIINSSIDSKTFARGFKKFNQVVSVVKNFNNLRIAQISTRPKPFLSVMINENELLERFGIEVVPISLLDIVKEVKEMVSGQTSSIKKEVEDIKSRIDCSQMKNKDIEKITALKQVILRKINQHNCNAAALECWSLFPDALGVLPCFVVSELTDMKIPVACETDIHGAVTSILLQAATFEEKPTFFADLTIRHPDNDNAELLWHCGPFPYSIKAPQENAGLVDGKGQWQLKTGDITLARFDAIDGEYSLFAGEARGIEGPKTEGTYLWFEVDDWKKWEEKFIFGPYIHHIVGIHGRYAAVLQESCKYIPGLKADSINQINKSLS
ncbi:MAG: L-fucose/L-arabinose isomerase family protein [Halanaerobiaceae bacterium]